MKLETIPDHCPIHDQNQEGCYEIILGAKYKGRNAIYLHCVLASEDLAVLDEKSLEVLYTWSQMEKQIQNWLKSTNNQN